MSTMKTIRWADAVGEHDSSNHVRPHVKRTDQHLRVPSQIPPHTEQERVYPRPISRKDTGGSGVIDSAQKRVRAYTDRAPTLTGGESIDPTGKTGLSAVPSSNARSRQLSRSNAFRADSPPSMDVDRARILAFGEVSMGLEKDRDAKSVRECSQTATLSRDKYNNRKRTNSRFAPSQAVQTRGMTVSGTAAGSHIHATNAFGDGSSGSSHLPLSRSELPRLAKLDTGSEVSLQARRGGARGGILGPEKHPSKFKEEFTP